MGMSETPDERASQRVKWEAESGAACDDPLEQGGAKRVGERKGRIETAMPEPMFQDQVLDRLAALGDITVQPLFGGYGIYWRDVIFAIVFGGKLYLKVDEQSKADFVSRGMGPFRPNDRQTIKSYYEVPPGVLDDREELMSWAKEAIRAAQS
jgi:DNA transformation protein